MICPKADFNHHFNLQKITYSTEKTGIFFKVRKKNAFWWIEMDKIKEKKSVMGVLESYIKYQTLKEVKIKLETWEV